MPVQLVTSDVIYKLATYFQASVFTGLKLICLAGQTAHLLFDAVWSFREKIHISFGVSRRYWPLITSG